jgi:hypothetical protein
VVFGAPIDCDTEWTDDVARRRLGDTTRGPRLWDAVAEELREVLYGMERAIHPAATKSN